MEESDLFAISSDDPCYWPLQCLWDGDPGPLIELLEDGRNAVHPLLQSELAKMLAGTHSCCRLTFKVRGKRGRPKAEISPKEIVSRRCQDSNGRKLSAKEVAQAFNGAISPRTVERAELELRKKQDRLRDILRAHANRQKSDTDFGGE